MVRRDVGNRRLLKLAGFLRTLPRERFYFATWVGPSWRGDQTLSCGTTACALGWAATMPFFRRLGLRLAGGDGRTAVPAIESGETGVEAATQLFGISLDEAIYLFLPSGPSGGLTLKGRVYRAPGSLATPKKVAAHIERFVKRREKAA